MHPSVRASAIPSFVALSLLAVAPLRADVVSGRIVDAQGAPVTGAKVTLSQLKLTVTTAADGLFSITTPTTSLAEARSAGPGFTLSDRGLSLDLAAAQDVRVDLLALDGRRLAGLHRGRLAAGAHLLPLGDWQRGLTPGVYALSVEVGGLRSTARIATQGSLGLPGGTTQAFLRKSAAAAPDTLVVTKAACFPVKKPLASTSTQALGDVALAKDPIWVNNSTQDQYNSIIVSSVDKRMEASLYMIIKAMIVIESSFNAKAISMYDVQLPCGTHSYGLIQVTPGCERGYATLPNTTAPTATISGGLNGNPAVLTYVNDADKAAGNTIVKENNIVINLVSNPSNPLWATSAFNPDYSIDHGAKALFDVRAEMKRKFTTCSEVQWVTMALAGYNQGSGTVSGCTSLNAGGVNYSNKVLDQYRKFCQTAGITPVY